MKRAHCPEGLGTGRARKSWPPVSGTGGAGGSPAGHVRRPSVPAEPPAAGFTCLPSGAPLLPRRRAGRHFVRLRLHGGVMKCARRSFESFATLAKAGAAPGQPDGYEKNRVGNGKPAARFPGGPGQGQPARRTSSPGHHRRCHRTPPPRRRSPVSRTSVKGRPARGTAWPLRGTGTLGGDEQVKFPALPRDRHPSSGHPLPDMPAHHRLPAREGQRCPDRALPPGPPRNTRPPLLPVASHTQIAHRPQRPLPGRGQLNPAGPRHRPQGSPAVANGSISRTVFPAWLVSRSRRPASGHRT